VVATSDPACLEMERDVSFAASRVPAFEVAPPDRIQAAL